MAEESPNKKPRPGVGTSVVNLERSPVDDFVLLLCKLRVERLRPKGLGQVITAHRLDTLPTVCQMLNDHNILSIPILNQMDSFFGFIEQKDIIRHVVSVLFPVEDNPWTHIEKFFTSANMFKNTFVYEAMQHPVSLISPNHIISQGHSLYVAWEILAKEKTHRVPIIDSDRRIVDIITQSMLIDFLWQNIEKIGTAAQINVRDIVGAEDVLTVRDTEKAYVAFRNMIQYKVAGLAVVDQDGKLVNNISLRDFRGAHTDAKSFWRLWSNVIEFKNQMLADYPPPVAITKPLCLDFTGTLYHVVEVMALNHVHRVYIVQDMVPMKVITQTDVLNTILSIQMERSMGTE